LRNHPISICDSLHISWRLAEEPAQKMIDLWRTKTNKAAARIHHVSSEYPVSPELGIWTRIDRRCRNLSAKRGQKMRGNSQFAQRSSVRVA
jgi:hypothetical protein